jgi:hypothetical protein
MIEYLEGLAGFPMLTLRRTIQASGFAVKILKLFYTSVMCQ